MTTSSAAFVGVDVSKETLDVAVLGQRRVEQYANTQEGIGTLLKAMRQLAPAPIVVEATSGYERAVVLGGGFEFWTLLFTGKRLFTEELNKFENAKRSNSHDYNHKNE